MSGKLSIKVTTIEIRASGGPEVVQAALALAGACIGAALKPPPQPEPPPKRRRSKRLPDAIVIDPTPVPVKEAE